MAGQSASPGLVRWGSSGYRLVRSRLETPTLGRPITFIDHNRLRF